jgi:hypothetical protein
VRWEGDKEELWRNEEEPPGVLIEELREERNTML